MLLVIFWVNRWACCWRKAGRAARRRVAGGGILRLTEWRGRLRVEWVAVVQLINRMVEGERGGVVRSVGERQIQSRLDNRKKSSWPKSDTSLLSRECINSGYDARLA